MSFDWLDAATHVAEATQAVSKVRDHYRAGENYRNSKQYQFDMELVQKLEKKSSIVACLTVILWAILIIGTIVLIFTGNDVILTLLHL